MCGGSLEAEVVDKCMLEGAGVLCVCGLVCVMVSVCKGVCVCVCVGTAAVPVFGVQEREEILFFVEGSESTFCKEVSPFPSSFIIWVPSIVLFLLMEVNSDPVPLGLLPPGGERGILISELLISCEGQTK